MEKPNRFTLTGAISKMKEPETFGNTLIGKVWLSVDEQTQYPQTIEFTFLGSNCDNLDQYTAGSKVTITFSLSGREKNGNVYNTLKAFQIQPAD